MSEYLSRPVSELTEPPLLALMEELTAASEVDHADSPLPFVPFLILCQHPGGGRSQRIPFHPRRTRPGYLETRIDKIDRREIQDLCEELASVIGEPLEMLSNTKLMTFLNFVVRALDKKRTGIKRRRI